MTNLQDNTPTEVSKILKSKSLEMHIKIKLNRLGLSTLMSEEDVINYVLMCLIQAFNSGTVIAHPIAWARTVSDRYINSQYKRNKNSMSLESDKIEYLSNHYHQEFNDCDERDEIWQKIKELKLDDQEIIKMHFFEGLSWKEVARMLSIKEGKIISDIAARQRGSRAIDKLRQKYIDDF